jgi:hypothetical protein
MAEMRASPVKSKTLKRLADIVRMAEDQGQMEFLPFNPMTLFPVSSTTLENLAYGNLPMAIPSQSNIPITKTGRKQEVAELAGLLPMVPATSRGVTQGANYLGDVMTQAVTRNPQATSMRALSEISQMSPFPQLTGYHGSPHGPITQFELEKVGTGSGTRNFGEGIYIAEHPAIAGAFRKGRIPSQENPEGFLYQVDIPDALVPKMLNWYEDVPEDLRARLSEKAMEQFGTGLSPSSGERLYKDLAFSFKMQGSKNPEMDASKWLASQGVPGIKYENLQMIKGQGRDTHNYVVFEPEKIKVEKINDDPLEQFLQGK